MQRTKKFYDILHFLLLLFGIPLLIVLVVIGVCYRITRFVLEALL